MFKIGDSVVHPQHGVGYVVKLEDRQFEAGVTRRYYEVFIPGGSTVWVPVDLAATGLRRLAARSDLVKCRKILVSRPSPLSDDARFRQSELTARLNQGTIAAHCEVVRDLSAYGSDRPGNRTIAGLLRVTQEVLRQEWAMVEEITVSEAGQEIDSLLEKSRLTLSEAET